MTLYDRLTRFRRADDGGLTILSLYFVAISMIVGGLAIDFTNRAAKETRLQTAADAVAHGALLTRVRETEEAAVLRGLELARYNLPPELHGAAVKGTDITFGRWDSETRTFTPDANARDAVEVTARRNVQRDNIVTNLLLQTVGYDGWEVETRAIFALVEPPCFQHGFIARNYVDVQSNNFFGEWFCLHGNEFVSLNSNNTFDPGSIVSMPDLAMLDIPQSGYETNVGLEEALREAYYQFNVIEELDEIAVDLLNASGDYTPAYISGAATIDVPGKKLDPSSFEYGRIHRRMDCGANEQITFDAGEYDGFVFVTNCKVKFNQGVQLYDVVLATTNTDAKSFNSPASLQLGRDDNCTPGGGTALLTLGGMEVAADLRIFGSQVLARGSITFSAQADGIEGVSMISGDAIDSSSNIAMNGCPPEGMDLLAKERVVRMVQ